ncbi:hypothetical protein ALC62_12065 [Cyphomyrmex costatus]|uniref:Tesmin/TSO1-like CXC domain-containing protein n=1 Tax=Cyphomyrmex costatus TaxID=456900 RepID=A0A151IC05_9HYME|nr:hypothetical protein ALC62_12065 [Cyphomyrmex costatus]
MKNALNDVPVSLQFVLSEIIMKDKRGSEEIWQKKCISIAHAIIAAVRPRSFLSTLQIGVGTYLYKKFASKNLINILSAIGLSASYSEVTRFERACINRPQSKVLEGSFSQFVFDNADFNTNTIDGRGTFHAMGGIHCVTPKTGIEAEKATSRTFEATSAAEIVKFGKIDLLSYTKHKSAGLLTIKVANIVALRQLSLDIVPTIPDLVWLYGKWILSPIIPGWNGFMEQATANNEYHISKIIYLSFINAPPSDYDTIFTSLMEAKKICAQCYQETCIVTFDQPLYWKARDIVEAMKDDFEHMIVRLGGFHLLMSFLGAIGHIMSGSGIEEVLTLIYAGNCVQKILSGHAYSRAIRAHFLMHLTLTKVLFDSTELTEEECNIMDYYVESIDQSEVLDAGQQQLIQNVQRKLSEKLRQTEESSPTAKLWVQYHRMVTLVKHFVEAERSGNWTLHLDTIQQMLPYFHASGHFLYAKSAHLYLQDMRCLEQKMPSDEYQKFVNGFFTIRRTNKFWSGIMSDQTIEQCYMQGIKTAGGLTGRSFTDSTTVAWTLGSLRLQYVCEEVESFAGVACATTEQHIDMRSTRVIRDNSDVEKLYVWFSEHNPFPEGKELISLGTGIIGNNSINCHKALEVGSELLKKIVGNNFESLSFKRKEKVLPLSAINSSIKIDSSAVPINPLLLFQRISILKNSEEDMKKYLEYELSPFPLSLFTENGMRKGTKSSLYTSFKTIQEQVFGESHLRVIDGGFLLHKVHWGRLVAFGEICNKYVAYISQHFGKQVMIVFDGYPENENTTSTKKSERMRRSRKFQVPECVFDANTVPTCSSDKFFANEKNKVRFIAMLMEYLRQVGISVQQAFEDADVTIVTTAIAQSSIFNTVEIVGEDIDLLVLLLGLAPQSRNIFFRKPAKGKVPPSLYSPSALGCSESVANNILFVHAFSGCDTTSSFFNIGKSKFLSVINKSAELQGVLHLFKQRTVDKGVLTSAGERFTIALYNGSKEEQSIDSLRYKQFSKSAMKNKFNLSTLPPTIHAIRQHTFRTYHQVQQWLGFYHDPEEWGWRRSQYGLEPVPNTCDPAPPELLKLISCKCKSKCGNACGCRKAGLKCSAICLHCGGQDCENIKHLDVLHEDDDDCHVDKYNDNEDQCDDVHAPAEMLSLGVRLQIYKCMESYYNESQNYT